MQNFENIEELVSHMFEKLDGDDTVSVVADKDLAVAIMKELLEYDNVILNFANVDTYDYDKEYLVSLYDDTDTDYWYVSIEQLYNYEKEMYFGTDGYILFHEDINSKALVDMQNNENIELSDYDWFIIGEDEETDDTDEIETEESCHYTVNGKSVTKDEYNAFVSKFAPDKVIKTKDKPSTTSKVEYKINGRNATKEELETVLTDIEDRYLDNIEDMLLRYLSFMDNWNDMLRLLF